MKELDARKTMPQADPTHIAHAKTTGSVKRYTSGLELETLTPWANLVARSETV